jgi:hypothetical protein
MYIERDSRKTSPGKEQQSGNEYLARCLDLLIQHMVQEPPRILGKWQPFTLLGAQGCLLVCGQLLHHLLVSPLVHSCFSALF